jgi:hypothetical protein
MGTSVVKLQMQFFATGLILDCSIDFSLFLLHNLATDSNMCESSDLINNQERGLIEWNRYGKCLPTILTHICMSLENSTYCLHVIHLSIHIQCIRQMINFHIDYAPRKISGEKTVAVVSVHLVSPRSHQNLMFLIANVSWDELVDQSLSRSF